MNKNIGVIHSLSEKAPYFKEVVEFGLKTCQLVGWDPELWTKETAGQVREEIRETGICVTAFWAGWPGRSRESALPSGALQS